MCDNDNDSGKFFKNTLPPFALRTALLTAIWSFGLLVLFWLGIVALIVVALVVR